MQLASAPDILVARIGNLDRQEELAVGVAARQSIRALGSTEIALA